MQRESEDKNIASEGVLITPSFQKTKEISQEMVVFVNEEDARPAPAAEGLFGEENDK